MTIWRIMRLWCHFKHFKQMELLWMQFAPVRRSVESAALPSISSLVTRHSESRGHNFTLNATFDEIEVSKYDGVIIPGGKALEYLAMNDVVVKLIYKFHDSAKTIVAICHGQQILAAACVLKRVLFSLAFHGCNPPAPGHKVTLPSSEKLSKLECAKLKVEGRNGV